VRKHASGGCAVVGSRNRMIFFDFAFRAATTAQPLHTAHTVLFCYKSLVPRCLQQKCVVLKTDLPKAHLYLV
jgi:hypothetical protein